MEITTFLFYLPFLLTFAVVGIYAERKIAGFIQDRMGPMDTGKFGLLQTIADVLKLLMKEDITPARADKKLFPLAPIIVFSAIVSGFAVLPLTSGWTGAGAQVGVFYLLTIITFDVVGILIAGWAANNKYALFGAERSVAQLISYEVPMGLCVLAVVCVCQTLDLQAISFQQGIFAASAGQEESYLFGIKALGIEVSQYGGFLTWNIFRAPVLIPVALIFFIASLAEANRAPFDLAEAESELIAGYNVEYSGFKFAMLMLGEYGMMLLMSILMAVLFFGSWNTPLPNIGGLPLAEWTSGEPGTLSGHLWGGFWILSKALVVIFFQMVVRWTYPRLRVDQLMIFAWKYLTPASLVLVLLSVIWRMLMI
ncbi:MULTISPECIES: complex I subunit 1/NuoH family protein [Persicobacter]|uniref:NADH-quinone oxidoreductase subunit H n=1 Tax=Persicobacter diffluens TaxID=981 RepID=A0AAN4VVA5_9BACT|nr:complex I subunit 1 family protein [Persicobacter sp. CCB-QB2]GJM60779.1 NADH-quinone oxidoreductase subunit H [Persicobacter diffluens]